ncbi:hypothetical protein A2823_01200 [Candidatus Nomurabacteria bacterium RIFCSPHIGHO2_01_FULL_41_91]|nr:MAG: hypothetical protein A2823_01200 [Candidatus Nomurabacteria bacterium RIFCSPHIGHO2_01_FULL_41_91]
MFGKGAQFCDLGFNTQNLLILNIGGLAGVEEKFIVVHKIVWLIFNWAKQILKIARDLEPALGEPRCARRASESIPFRASRGRINRQNS